MGFKFRHLSSLMVSVLDFSSRGNGFDPWDAHKDFVVGPLPPPPKHVFYLIECLGVDITERRMIS